LGWARAEAEAAALAAALAASGQEFQLRTITQSTPEKPSPTLPSNLTKTFLTSLATGRILNLNHY